MNETVRRQAANLRIKIASIKESIKTSPKGAATTIAGLLRQSGIYDNMIDESSASRALQEVKKAINSASYEIANSPKNKFLKAASALGELRVHYENLISGIRANLDIVEDGLRELADIEDETIAGLTKRKERLEAEYGVKKFAIAYACRVSNVTNRVETLSKTEPGRVKPVLRKLAADLSSLAELMKEHGDARADGPVAIREIVKQTLESLKTK